MRFPFSMTLHQHAYGVRCRICHLHSCVGCRTIEYCTSKHCEALAGSLVRMGEDDCLHCLGEPVVECESCSAPHSTRVFPKCHFCFGEEMKEFWWKYWTPGKVRVCRCNRCGG